MFKLGDDIKSKKRKVEFDKGRHHRAKLGFILMSTDLAAEADFFEVIPKDVAIHITRLKTDDYTSNETLTRHIDYMAEAASRLQPDVKPDVISYHCTSGSIIIGEDRVKKEIKKGAPYTIPMTLVTGVVDALKELNAKNIVVGTPYLDEINKCEAEFLVKKGFNVLNIQGLNLDSGISFGKITPEYWKQFAIEIDQPDADAIFLSCGGIRALEVAQDIENITGKPCVTSNQGQIWSCLRRAGIMDKISGYGQIFQREGGNFN
jgi:maleate isomerase